jgi:voltage-gated potassium channel
VVPTARLTKNADAYERFDRAVEAPMMVLAIVWLPVLIIPFVVSLKPGLAQSFAVIDYTVWGLFVVEYLIKLTLAPSRRRFVRTHILDLVVIALPMLRPLRVLRVFRAGALAGEATKRGRKVFTDHGLHYVLLSALVVVFAGSGLVLVFERHAKGANIHDYGQALWWAVVTVTTVGYGDRYPVTPAGQGVAVVLMLLGIALLGVITANVASFFVGEDTKGLRGEITELREQLARMEALLLHLAGPDVPRELTTSHEGAASP